MLDNTKYGFCECGLPLHPKFSSMKETKKGPHGVYYETTRTIWVCDYLFCEYCDYQVLVDDSFDIIVG